MSILIFHNHNDFTLNLSTHLKPELIFGAVKEASRQLNFETYVIGGFVRDILLERNSKDIDFVCVGSGIELAKNTASALGKNTDIAVYKNFGTALVTHKGHDIEFVGARKESYRSDSRKPIVEDGSLEEDQDPGVGS